MPRWATLPEYPIKSMLSLIRTASDAGARRELWYRFHNDVDPFLPFTADALQGLIAIATQPHPANGQTKAAVAGLLRISLHVSNDRSRFITSWLQMLNYEANQWVLTTDPRAAVSGPPTGREQ
jgi:hypothetical protein